MAHDNNGDEVKEGDTVTVTFVVRSVSESVDGGYVTLEAVDPDDLVGVSLPALSCAASLVTKVEDDGE